MPSRSRFLHCQKMKRGLFLYVPRVSPTEISYRSRWTYYCGAPWKRVCVCVWIIYKCRSRVKTRDSYLCEDWKNINFMYIYIWLLFEIQYCLRVFINYINTFFSLKIFFYIFLNRLRLKRLCIAGQFFFIRVVVALLQGSVTDDFACFSVILEIFFIYIWSFEIRFTRCYNCFVFSIARIIIFA